jgi:hypothetical protein
MIGSNNNIKVEMIINMNKKTVRFKENKNLIPYKVIHIPPKVIIEVLFNYKLYIKYMWLLII